MDKTPEQFAKIFAQGLKTTKELVELQEMLGPEENALEFILFVLQTIKDCRNNQN